MGRYTGGVCVARGRGRAHGNKGLMCGRMCVEVAADGRDGVSEYAFMDNFRQDSFMGLSLKVRVERLESRKP